MDTLLTIFGFIFGTAWRSRRFMIAFVALCTVASIGVSLAIKPMFRASTLLVPNQSSSGLTSALGDLSGLAGQFGISAGGEDPSRLFPEILRSRALAHSILNSRVTASDSTECLYLDHLGVDAEDRATQLELATKLFQEKRSRIVLNPKNSSLKIIVYDHDPLVAAAIANRMANRLDQLNQDIGRSNAREQREFIAGRRAEISTELQAQEERQKVFRETNRNYTSSPHLMLEFERISRRVRLGEEVYLTLTRELELAKIDEIKDVPVINVLDKALSPTSHHYPRRSLIVVATFLLSIVVGLFLVLAWSGRQHFRTAFRTSQDQPLEN